MALADGIDGVVIVGYLMFAVLLGIILYYIIMDIICYSKTKKLISVGEETEEPLKPTPPSTPKLDRREPALR
jgi:hypothetical protein